MGNNHDAAALHTAALRFATTGILMLVAFFLAASLTACGGGGGADATVPGQCYVNGAAAPAEACRPGASVQPVVCNASGVCK